MRVAAQGRRLVPDRLREPVPRLAGHVAALPLPVAREGVPALVDLLRRDQAQDAEEPRLGARSTTIAARDLPYADKLDLYAKIADERFETARFEEFCAKHLGHLDEVAWEFFGTPEAKEAVRLKVAALFPEHEVEKFTELFWSRIDDWRGASRAHAQRRRGASMFEKSRWYSTRLEVRGHARALGLVRAARAHLPDGGRRRRGDRALPDDPRPRAAARRRASIKVYSCDSVAGRVWFGKEGSPEHRMWMMHQFHQYVKHEVVPAIRSGLQVATTSPSGRRARRSARSTPPRWCAASRTSSTGRSR